jgi:hypothetical protein
MKTSISLLAAIMAISGGVSAMKMNHCTISRNSGSGGNQFVMDWQGVPSKSASTICGHFQDDLNAQIASANIQMRGSVTCSTANTNMFTVLTLDKQSCHKQAATIVKAMKDALGDAGKLEETIPCNFKVAGC